MRFLILRFSAIGDIVLTSPVIRLLRQKFPEAQIDFATKDVFVSWVSQNPYLNTVYGLKANQSLRDFSKQLPDYDYIIDLHHNLRTLRLKWQLKGKKYTFQKLNFKKWLYTKFKINRLPDIHIVDRYVNTLKPLGITNDGLGLDFFIPEQTIQDINTQYPDIPPITLILGATYYTKKYPLHHIQTLITQLSGKVVLLGGKAEMAEAHQLSEQFGEKVLNLVGKTNILESAAVLKRTETVITNDTGMMHIAAALKRYIISIWGNTTPNFGMYPYQTPHIIIENKKLSCRPCSKIGYQTCPKKHFNCMNSLEPQQILEHLSKKTPSH